MVDILDILSSGEVEEIKLGTLQVGAALLILNSIQDRIEAEGIGLPTITGAEAAPNSDFWNIDVNRVCWKSPEGELFKYTLKPL